MKNWRLYLCFAFLCLFTQVDLNSQSLQRDSLLDRSQSIQAQLPKPIGLVNDFEQLFSIAEIDSLNKLLLQYNRMLDIQISVVSLNEDYTSAEDFDAYTLKLANHWGVGDSKKNNGILFCLSRSLRMIRIHNGYGIESILSNEETAEIIQNVIIPHFKLGNYFEGTIAGINQIMVIMHLNKK
jgi:uncharacterized protein